MQSPENVTGWTGEGSSTIGKRKTRQVGGQGIIPTPPRTRFSNQLPTPESGRRTSKRIAKPQPTTTALPTPETLPRKRKAPPSPVLEDEEETSDPSPSGHTTFVYSHSEAGPSKSEAAHRRRPGLTFAQQMAAASAQAPVIHRHGAGVGMINARSGGHQVDKIALGLTGSLDDNPFIIPGSADAIALASPGRATRHRPAMVSPQNDNSASPRTRPRSARLGSPPIISADPVHSSTSLLSPPGTSRTNRTRPTPIPSSPATRAQKAKQERLLRMRDEDDNPFLIKPGQKAVHRPRQIVDETRETVTYVFRGAKKIFANPFIPHDLPVEGSDLRVEDEDFEPHPCPPPRLLWPTAPEWVETPRRGRKVIQQSTSQHRLLSEDAVSPPSSPMPMMTPGGPHDSTRYVSDDEFLPETEEEDDHVPVRRGLLFGPSATIKAREPQLLRRQASRG